MTSRSRPAVTPRQWLLLAAAAVAGLAGGAALRLAQPPGTDIGDRVDLAPLLGDRVSPASGPADAPVTMVVFTDYQCGPCRASHGAMTRAVAAAGDVRVVYRDLPVNGPRSVAAARVALASAAQGRYVAVHDALMRAPLPLEEPALRRAVAAAGGDWAAVEQGLAAPRALDDQLARNAADALRLGVAGTPTYLIGTRRITGRMSERDFLRAFAAARATPY
ncbi:disulfide bond formation protein DsbA [Erythrobacteraceae bacterium CFH 75059]|uniref:DsbA family protein n=1 Tax=Qipengyuania thermophila TaxID=2509361 RepID=UPI0010219E0C|nr:thioredoxin domain-containing protein [Qipengyuania thermophila]TCD06854.1 disulfide bond formation protein DsbA [Erythrobacteraceae bacterium CFH 75059]